MHYRTVKARVPVEVTVTVWVERDVDVSSPTPFDEDRAQDALLNTSVAFDEGMYDHELVEDAALAIGRALGHAWQDPAATVMEKLAKAGNVDVEVAVEDADYEIR